MKPIKRYHKILLSCLLPASLILSGCADDESMSSYTVKVTNITNAQPLTPVAVVLHKTGYNAWSIGSASTSGLEKLAEGGDTADFIAEAKANTHVMMTAVAGTEAFGPGASVSTDISIDTDEKALLSLATMLANTNDAFAGNVQVPVGAMDVNDVMTVYSHVHDAGTELNTESAGTLAGPADVSTAADKAYSATRDDIHDFVTLHPGVVTQDDGLSTSVLTEAHRWMDVAARIDITRTK